MKVYQESSFSIDGRKIVCTISCRLAFSIYGEKEPRLEINFKERGVAMCSPEDEFNEDFGKKLAERRASIKVYRHTLRELNKKKRYYKGMFEEVEGSIRKSKNLRDYLEKKEYKK